MPWESNAAAKSSIKGLKKYSESQVTRFRKAANNAFASCEKKKKGNCESYAIAVGWTALKGKKSKNEDGTFIEGNALMEALVDCLSEDERLYAQVKLEGNPTKATVYFNDKDKKPLVFEGENLSYEVDEAHYKLYIYDAGKAVGVFNSWAGVKLDY